MVIPGLFPAPADPALITPKAKFSPAEKSPPAPIVKETECRTQLEPTTNDGVVRSSVVPLVWYLYILNLNLVDVLPGVSFTQRLKVYSLPNKIYLLFGPRKLFLIPDVALPAGKDKSVASSPGLFAGVGADSVEMAVASERLPKFLSQLEFFLSPLAAGSLKSSDPLKRFGMAEPPLATELEPAVIPICIPNGATYQRARIF